MDHKQIPSTSLIDAATEFVWIVGDPIAQVKAPQAMNPHYLAAGDNLLVIPAPIATSELKEVFHAAKSVRNVRGWIVTVPHKIPLAAWVDALSPAARIAGAVNAVRFHEGKAHGDLFDGYGFVASLLLRGFQVEGSAVLVLGAGGVGSAIALALAEAGAERIAIHDVDRPRAGGLVERLKHSGPPGTHYGVGANSSTKGMRLLVNASPVGMSGDGQAPIDVTLLRPDLAVAEVIMSPEFTPLLQAARELGCEIHPGKQVLSGQLDKLLNFFR